MLIDAHVAVGDTAFFDHRDPAAVVAAMDEANVETAVLGPMGRWLAVDNRDSNDTLAGWATRWPGRLAWYAATNPWYGQRAVDELRRAADAGACGVKFHPGQQGIAVLDPLADRVLSVAEELGLVVYVVTGIPVSSEPYQLTEAARRHPAASFVMGRSGRTDFKPDFMPALAGSSNLFAESAHNDQRELQGVLDQIGAGRLLFASDLPWTSLAQERRKLMDLDTTPAVRAGVARGNALGVFRLGARSAA
jgi:hypothetical protein